MSLAGVVRAAAGAVAVASAAAGLAGGVLAQGLGDERALHFHVDQRQVVSGEIDLETVIDAGRRLFAMKFTELDGAGRPAATGAALPTRRAPGDAGGFLRTNGPDSLACVSCHNDPEPGGGGDFAANVFVLAQERAVDVFSIHADAVNERGTTGMHGSGLIELLAREMTADLLALRAQAVAEARSAAAPVRIELRAKGVSFGALTAHPTGSVDVHEVEGLAEDLVVRPWSQKGVVISLREFTISAMNHHHGMQASERYGLEATATRDFDEDNVVDELTPGDVTALTLYQASLPPPRQILPEDPAFRTAIQRGEALFTEIGCTSCHVSELILDRFEFTEPGPINGEGTLKESLVDAPVVLDLSQLPWFSDLERTEAGGAIVRAFTDFKRHTIADEETPHFANEALRQGFRLQPRPGAESDRARARMRGGFSQDFVATDEFLTRRLWASGNTSPYGHRADLTTLNEAILAHGGEAREHRMAYQALGQYDRASVIEFLRSWRIVPVPAPPNYADPREDPVHQRLVEFWRRATLTP